MKNKIKLFVVFIASLSLLLAGCRKADRVSYNLSREADDLNITRKVTVINSITNKILFQVTGNMSIEYNSRTKQLNVIALGNKGEYKKHIIGISDNVSYVVEDVTGVKGVDTKYRMYFNPDMVIPIDPKLSK